jgi:parallel beta-helix repeat protein
MDKRLKVALVVIVILLVVSGTVLVYVRQTIHTPSEVSNIDTGLSYATIQEAINAPETRNGDTLIVNPGIHRESVEVNKTLTIRGKNRDTTIVEKGAQPEVFWIKADDTTVTNLTVRNCEFGIWCRGVRGCSVVGNKATNLSATAIKIESSFNCTVKGNEITNGTLRGIELANSFNITVMNNYIRNVRISNMTLAYGAINLESSDNNTITLNQITNNAYGIFLYDSSNNMIYNNNFVANTHQAYTTLSTNEWNNGYPSGGNYWSDYRGVDLYKGLYQNVTGSDGIGDTPYIIQTPDQDKYPFMQPLNGTAPTGATF